MAKAPESFQVPRISWNQKGHLLLSSHNESQKSDDDLDQATIANPIQGIDTYALYVNEQGTWYIQAIHGTSSVHFLDKGIAMSDLKNEVEFRYVGIHSSSTQQYITHLDNRKGKLHRSVIIPLIDNMLYSKCCKKGMTVFREIQKTGVYLPAWVTDKCGKC